MSGMVEAYIPLILFVSSLGNGEGIKIAWSMQGRAGLTVRLLLYFRHQIQDALNLQLPIKGCKKPRLFIKAINHR